MRTAPRRRHGFMLLEVMVGAVLASIVLAAAMGRLATARLNLSAAARDATARSLLLEGEEKLRARPFAALAGGTENPVPGLSATYKRVTTVGAATPLALAGGQSTQSRVVTITVEYASPLGTRSQSTTFTLLDL